MAVWSVSRSGQHGLAKQRESHIELTAGVGVVGDAHAGERVQHTYLRERDPTQPNLRQVHLLAYERLSQWNLLDFDLAPGDLGENITTCGIVLELLPRLTVLHIGSHVQLVVQGTRKPCVRLDARAPGLRQLVTKRGPHGSVSYTIGIMCTVQVGGRVCVNDAIRIDAPVAASVLVWV
jgi:hypothetical protein